MNESSIWGPHYWFFLHTICKNYPKSPSETIKKKYYDLFQNFYLFLPQHQEEFKKLLNKYPVQAYLDSQKSLYKWINFVHNKINNHLNKDVFTLEESIIKYNSFYSEKKNKNNQYYFMSIVLLSILVICFLNNY